MKSKFHDEAVVEIQRSPAETRASASKDRLLIYLETCANLAELRPRDKGSDGLAYVLPGHLRQAIALIRAVETSCGHTFVPHYGAPVIACVECGYVPPIKPPEKTSEPQEFACIYCEKPMAGPTKDGMCFDCRHGVGAGNGPGEPTK